MKQATGKTDTPSVQQKMSIRLRSGGHSFPVADQSFPPHNDKVEFSVLTPKTLLVPAELFVPAHAARYLCEADLACDESETVVYSDPSQPIVAVMALDKRQSEAVRQYAGKTPCYTSPLLREPTGKDPFVWIAHIDDLTYIKVFDNTLRLAEVFPYTSQEDFLYLLARLDSQFGFSRYTVFADGIALPLRKALKPYFRRIVCE